MKIAYIGEFERIYDEEGIARSFEKLGHTVYRYPERGFNLTQSKALLDQKPDILLFAKLKISLNLRAEVIKSAKKEGIKTACWVPDLYWGLHREYKIITKDPIFSADYVFTPDGGNEDKWAKFGINHKLLRQGIYDECCFLGGGGFDEDIVFVGSQNPEFPYRTRLMQFLERTYGSRFRWIGKKNSDEMRNETLNDLYTGSKIIIGDSVYSPSYWSNRIYETIGRGGFIIHPMIEDLDKEYEPYKEFIPYSYNNFNELKEKIDFFLEDKGARDRIRMAGFERTKKDHTLLNRCKEFINYVK